mmetsp:Transcript_13252/g.31499  ORF Transcript_13252/g.31499 Transcript_13252/m.31499 type:complete len:298 (+) Transcript_13252:119-1012(+)
MAFEILRFEDLGNIGDTNIDAEFGSWEQPVPSQSTHASPAPSSQNVDWGCSFVNSPPTGEVDDCVSAAFDLDSRPTMDANFATTGETSVRDELYALVKDVCYRETPDLGHGDAALPDIPEELDAVHNLDVWDGWAKEPESFDGGVVDSHVDAKPMEAEGAAMPPQVPAPGDGKVRKRPPPPACPHGRRKDVCPTCSPSKFCTNPEHSPKLNTEPRRLSSCYDCGGSMFCFVDEHRKKRRLDGEPDKLYTRDCLPCKEEISARNGSRVHCELDAHRRFRKAGGMGACLKKDKCPGCMQ